MDWELADWDDNETSGTWTASQSGWYEIRSGDEPRLICTHEECCYPDIPCTEYKSEGPS